MHKMKQCRKHQKREIQSTLCKKNEEERIPFKKLSFSLAEIVNTMHTERYYDGKVSWCFR